MTDLWQRLKQRKLVPWVAHHVAAAFASTEALQGTSIYNVDTTGIEPCKA